MPPPRHSRRSRPYRTAFDSQRCLVPANGFYEWQARGTKKQPYKIALRHGALIAFAGLWARWAPEDGDPVETFTIVTTRASKLVSEVHDRMPVIIAPADYQRWLTAPAAAAKRLLAVCAGLTIIAVGDRVNNLKNDDVSLLQPAIVYEVRSRRQAPAGAAAPCIRAPAADCRVTTQAAFDRVRDVLAVIDD